MKVGLFTALFGDKTLEEALDIAKAEGLQAVELGCGAYPGKPHCDPDLLLDNKSAQKKLLDAVEKRGLIISALSVHGNPLSPNRKISVPHHNDLVNTIKLASQLGVPVVNGFSGCPGDNPRARNPNWVTCAWPDEFREILEWQWKRRLFPYWREQAALLRSLNVKFAIEMHPGFNVYNPDTLMKLRSGLGKIGEWIGANFDPSHLWWQGIDPIKAVRFLGDKGAIFHVHAKDTRIDAWNSDVNGNLDTKSYGDILHRSWVFRTVGYGHDSAWWKAFISQLRAIGYDYVLSIEHEDGLMSPNEGLKKAISTLKDACIYEDAGKMFWAKD